MEFKVGDDVAVVMTDNYRSRRIIRRQKVEKVYKTGHVVVNGGTERYHQDGTDMARSCSFNLHHWSPELQAESDETERRIEVERKLYRFADAAKYGRNFAVIDAVMKLIPEEVFNLLEVPK